MCEHVFGAIKSASCSSYALCRTSLENEAVFGETAASALHHNFYVDDLLKSIEDLDSTEQIVKDVINMCKSGVSSLLASILPSLSPIIRNYCFQYQNIREEWE